LFHVTKTSNASKIRNRGIIPLQPSNWVKASSGERYGDGEIFAFEHMSDAVRWAMKWDWDLTKQMGSGKVSVVSFIADASDWINDDADPLGRSSAKGRWMKSHKAVRPNQVLSVIQVTKEIVQQEIKR
jgi:hypothetical protein